MLLRVFKVMASSGVMIAIPLCSWAGEPPFPSELMYPNVIKPAYQVGKFGADKVEFSEPVAACFATPNELLIGERGNKRLQIVDAAGRFVRFPEVKLSDRQLAGITALDCDADHVVLVTEATNEIIVMDNNFNVLTHFGGFGDGIDEFNNPSGVALFRDRIVVADANNNRIHIRRLDGTAVNIVGSYGSGEAQFNHPESVDVDKDGNIYVADSWNNRIQKISPTGEYLTQWGEWGSHSGFFATPRSVSVNGFHVYVSDLTNHRIQVFNLDGTFQFQWGRHPVQGHDGMGRTHYPWLLAVSPDEGSYALIEPIENRVQIFNAIASQKINNVNDSAWWDKATRFHYGSRMEMSGNLLAVSEPDTHSVLTFDVSGETPELISRLGGRGSELGKLIEPSGMAIDLNKGEILVTDAGNLRLQRLGLIAAGQLAGAELASLSTPLGFLTDMGRAISGQKSVFSSAVLRLDGPVNREKQQKFEDILTKRPLALSLDASETLIYPGAMKQATNGDIYLYNQAKAKILVLRNGEVISSFGGYGSGEGEFRSVHNMSFSKDQTKLFVVDPYNFRVQILDRSGKYISEFGSAGPEDDEFSSIFGITSGVDGFVYVTDETKHCITKWTESGQFVARFSRWGTEPGELYKPKGISQSSNGRLYVMSFGNHRGEIFSPDGNFIKSFGLADPQTKRGEELSTILTNRSAYTVSGTSLFSKDITALLNASSVTSRNGLREILTNDERFRIVVEGADAISAFSGPVEIRVSVSNASDGTPADVEMDVSALMLAHGHGLNSLPTISKLSTGVFRVEELRMGMPGLWEMYFDLRTRWNTERGQIAIFAR